MYSTGYSCQISVKLDFSRQIFEKYSNIKFNENPSGGSRVVPCGLTDAQTDATMLTFALGNFANAPQLVLYVCLFTVTPIAV